MKGKDEVVEEMKRGIKDSGKGKRGDKKMMDVWIKEMEVEIDERENGMRSLEMWKGIVEEEEKGQD